MTTAYVLIDYENVQPVDLGLLRGSPVKVRVFLGANQAKIPVALAAALQALGTNAEYVLLESSGPNALDFHVAYYIGVLSTQDPGARFHVISKDTGFDPLMKHLKLRGVVAQRFPTIASIPSVASSLDAGRTARFDAAVEQLSKLKAAKPRTETTLRSTLQAHFRKQLSDAQLTTLIDDLRGRGIVRREGNKVIYDLPTAP